MAYEFNGNDDSWFRSHDGTSVRENWPWSKSDTPTPDLADLTAGQERLFGKFVLNTDLDRTGRSSRIAKRLLRRYGIDAAGTLSAVGEDERRQLGYDTLQRLAENGAIGGKRAKSLKARLTEKESLASLDKEAALADVIGTDELASQSGELAQNLQGMLGPDVDMSSPAVASILAGLAEGRSTGLATFKNQLAANLEQRKTGVREGIGLNVIGENLDQTGALAEALNQLAREQQRLSEANRGTIRGSPTASLYTAFGGSNEGAVPFSNSLWASIQRAMSMYSMFSGGVGGGGGGSNTTHPTNSGGPVFAP